MQPDAIENLRAMRGGPRDGVLLRMSLANALLANSDMPAAITELHEALRFDPGYSAAWKLLGKTLAGTGSTASDRRLPGRYCCGERTRRQAGGKGNDGVFASADARRIASTGRDHALAGVSSSRRRKRVPAIGLCRYAEVSVKPRLS